MKLLTDIQQKLKAPKGQRNTFGNYNYRSCEDILEAVKPLLGKDGALTLSDEIVMLGERFYVKATAILNDGKESVSVTAFARESLEKKGMDTAQITGAASSYARKYALNGLFLIDDTKDADGQDNTEKGEAMKPYKVPRKVAPADDEAGGAVIKDEKQFMDADEIKEVQKQRIKDLLVSFGQEGLTKAEAKAFIKEQTQLDISKDDWATIITRLEATLDDTDPLAEALKA